MASTAWRRRTYGPVKPVKKAKVPPPKKPSVLELKAIYRTIDTASTGLHLDAMSLAVIWYNKALPYIKLKRPHETLTQTKLFLLQADWIDKAHAAIDDKEKERCFVSALDTYRRYISTVVQTPPVGPHLKEMRKHQLKFKAMHKTLDVRFDKLTTLLMRCFSSADFEFKVVRDVFYIAGRDAIGIKFDHTLNTMFISRETAVRMQKQIRSQGILPAIMDLAFAVARAMSFEGMAQGQYIVNDKKHLINYRTLMQDVVDFASRPDAPNRLVKKPAKPKKSKKEKIEEAIEASEDAHSVVGHAMTRWPKGKKKAKDNC